MQKFINKNLFNNVIINILSTGLLTGVIQLIIFPMISSNLSADEFGVLVTLYGFNQLIYVFLGNTINNIRLIYDDEINKKGSFTLLSIISLFLSFSIAFILYYLYGVNLNIFEVLILSIFTLLATLRAYLLVYFRLTMNYASILLTNIIIIIGLFVGLLLYNIFSFWGIIFLTSELFGAIYLLKTTPYLEERPTITEDFKPLLLETGNLALSNGISQSMGYLDRFLITPILGATSMSMYFTVGVFSKIINMFITPFNNVLLSYLNNFQNHNIKKVYIYYNVFWIIILIPIYYLMVFITPYLMEIFYPDFVEAGSYLIPIVSLGNIIKLLATIVNPFILKFKSLKYQTIVQITYGIVYLTLAIIFSILWGLWGFALATALSAFIKWLLLFIIGIK